MINYIEVRDKYSRLPFALIEPAECWFELAYYGVGEFEVYTNATNTAITCLKNGNYITIPKKPYAWVIESVEMTYKAGRGYMISAKGRQAKAILGKRIINKQTQRGADLTTAVFNLINKNAGAEAGDVRKIDGISELTSAVVQKITRSQVSYKNLLTYTDSLLQSYEVGAELTITDAATFRYNIYKGLDRSAEIIFSKTFDNLISSAYKRDETAFASYALIGGQGEGTGRILQELDEYESLRGIDRAEIFVDAKDISSKYTDDSGAEQELDLTDAAALAEYKSWLTEKGKTALAEKSISETFEGDIDINATNYKFGVDFNLGDRVTVQDDYLGVYITPRILKFTMRQDRDYGEVVEYGG